MASNSDLHALLRQDFRAFVLKVFGTLNPGEEFIDNWHIDAIIWCVIQILAGKTRRQMIAVPPRTLKSMIVSVALPAFILGSHPTRRIFVVSHSLDLAELHHSAFRKIIESDWYREAFPTMQPDAEKNTALTFRTNQGGERKALSVESKITGQGSHYTILDDPLDASDALNETAVEKTNNWIAEVLSSRFNRPDQGVLVLVMQRLAINDPVAHLADLESWNILLLPAIAPQDFKVPVGPEKVHLFRKDDLLHPKLLTAEFLDNLRSVMGMAAFSAQYLQAPLPPGGGVIDVSQFQSYQKLPIARDTRFISVDAASGSDSGSYSVFQIWQITNGRIYLVDSLRGRWPFPELRKRAIEAQKAFKADFFLIEAAASGLALVEELWAHYPPDRRRAMVQHYTPRQSKIVRMDQAMVPIEAGKVFLPENAEFLSALISELQAFPSGRNDDQVDALSQALWFFWREYKNNRHNPAYRARSRVIASGPHHF